MHIKRRTVVMVAIIVIVTFLLAGEIIQLKLTNVLENDSDEAQRIQYSKINFEQKIANYTKRYSINWYCKLDEGITAWQLAELWLTSRHITDPEKSTQIGCVLAALRKEKITHADTGVKGTQLKVSLTLKGGQRAAFKPKAYDRDYIMVGTPYAGKDRHNAEIAAFHLNRIIGMHNVPLVVGRKIDLESEIRPIAHKNLLNTFYYKDGNTCFYGKCYYCKGPETGTCADRFTMEGSITLWLPDSYALSAPLPHPWRRTYRPDKKAIWERDPNYCETVRNTRPYETAPRLLDIIDVAIFDFLISNADRHHYETFEYSKDSIVVALDNGKSFGNPYVDVESILTPLIQCCTVRASTYDRLLDLTNGVLGQVLYNVLLSEPLAPVLTPLNYQAVDRRLETVIQAIRNCIDKHKGDESIVLADDGHGTPQVFDRQSRSDM